MPDCLVQCTDKKREGKDGDVLHYEAVRVIIKDWERIYLREILDLIGREKPWYYVDYAKASTLIKVNHHQTPKRLFDNFKANKYRTRRNPDVVRFFNSAKKHVGLN